MRTRTPKIILNTREETLAFIAEHDEHFDWYSNPVKSLWLCSELNRFEADGYVYNRPAFERIIRENGLTLEQAEKRVAGTRTRTEGGLLGALVYLAQGYRREMQLEQDGWVRATQDALAALGKRCRAINNGSLGGELVVAIKRIGDRLRLCPLRSRTKAYVEYEDWWVKPLPNGHDACAGDGAGVLSFQACTLSSRYFLSTCR